MGHLTEAQYPCVCVGGTATAQTLLCLERTQDRCLRQSRPVGSD